MSERTTKVGLIAKEDPPQRGPRGIFDEVVELIPQLRAERGTWFRVAEFKSPTGAFSTAKKLRDRYPGQLEARGATLNGGSGLWARWTGNRANGDRP